MSYPKSDSANGLNVFDVVDKIWKITSKGELLGKAIDRKTRGHSRHVINVFWLGYYLIHHNKMKELIYTWWELILDDRSNMRKVKDFDPLEAVSNIWFYASLFHDFGNHVERGMEFFKHQKRLKEMFGGLSLPLPEIDDYPIQEIPTKINALITGMDDSIGDIVSEKLITSLTSKKPDHGLIAANYLLNNITGLCT